MFGVKSVKEYIPHREPFLFVDQIIELNDDHVVTELTVREDFEFFKGHYPSQPIMPGVLMCEAIFQSAGIYVAELMKDNGSEKKTPILSKIGQARFKRLVTPGEVIRMEIVPLEQKGPFFIMRGKTTNKAGEMVMNVEFTITAK